MNATDDRIPVTVLTGFLGSGKTTLLNRILTEQHGKRIAVIENEFGETGIDHELVINADEEIFEMNNGCICCTVRGDLIRILTNLMKRRDRFDYILVETTGLADPGPVAQTFFVDEEVKDRLRLDGIVTLVDARHIALHIDEAPEAREQIAFADVILLNKTDLVGVDDLEALESRIKGINAAARIFRTQNAAVNLDGVLNLGGFDLNRALDIDAAFLEPEYPFEWAGIYRLEVGVHVFALQPGEDAHMDAVVLPVGSEHLDEATIKQAVLAFSDEGRLCADGEKAQVGGVLNRIVLSQERAVEIAIPIEKPGFYALFTQHHPDEFDADFRAGVALLRPVFERAFKPDHEHDDEVTSVGIEMPGDLHPEKINFWMSDLLREKGQDIFRMKGVLSIRGLDRRLVFQGVHMLFDSQPDRPWGDAPRKNALIFIGRNLDRNALTEGFRACLA